MTNQQPDQLTDGEIDRRVTSETSPAPPGLPQAQTVKPSAKRPTRRELLLVIGQLQDIIGEIAAAYGNDRAPDRADKVEAACRRGQALCIRARSFDPPQEGHWPNQDSPEEPGRAP